MPKVESPGEGTWELAVIWAITFLIVNRQQRVRAVGAADINLECSWKRIVRSRGWSTSRKKLTKTDDRVRMREERWKNIIDSVARIAQLA